MVDTLKTEQGLQEAESLIDIEQEEGRESQDTSSDLNVITLKALTNQEAGKKIMYVDASDGAVCKMNDENELNFYRVCRRDPNR